MKPILASVFALLVFLPACGGASVEVTSPEMSSEVESSLERRKCCCMSTYEGAEGKWYNHVMCGYWNYDVEESSESVAREKCQRYTCPRNDVAADPTREAQ